SFGSAPQGFPGQAPAPQPPQPAPASDDHQLRDELNRLKQEIEALKHPPKAVKGRTRRKN
ncbi:MAG TPA: hypothetical protein VIV61_03900, partial [Candidatus Ozemobacteraceae bacterium]